MSAAFLALGFLLLLVWFYLRSRSVVLPGEVVYRDGPDAGTLVSNRYRVRGRPDYVVREGRGLVPVEVKSRSCGGRRPHDGERAQLLVYCLLTEENLGGAVTHGLLRYNDGSVVVPFGRRERREIIDFLAEMQATREAHRRHQQAGRCRACGFRAQCGEALA